MEALNDVQMQANASVGDVRLTQTDRELYESYGIGWQIMKQLASENEHDDIEDIIFGADSKSEHDQRKLHADTGGIDPPTCSQCHFARWPARISDNSNWICKWCLSPGSLNCHVSLFKSWNGYNRPSWKGGKWLCAKC